MADGLTNERRIDRLYQRAGFWTYRPENASYGDNDMWNEFDVGAVYDGDGAERNAQLILTQVKSNGTDGELHEFFDDTSPFQALRDVTVHFAVVHDGHGGPHAKPPAVRLAVPADNDDGYRWVVDERSEECDLGDGLVRHLGGDVDD